MESLTDKITKIKGKAKAEIERIIKEETAKQEIKELLNLTDKNFSHGFPYAHPAQYKINFEAEDLPEAIAIAEKLNPLPLVKYQEYKNGCVSFRPFQDYMKDEHFTLCCPYAYDIKPHWRGETKKNLFCFIQAGEYLLKVEIKVLNDPLTYVNHGEREIERANGRKGKEYFTILINNSGYFRKNIRWYSPEGCPNSFTLYDG